MSSQLFHLTASDDTPDVATMRFGLVVSEWNNHITDRLLAAAVDTLKQQGVPEGNITVKRVPGSFELVFGAAQFARSGLVDAIIAIGCVIRGDTPHFDYICQGTTQGLTDLNARGAIPVVYGLITTDTPEQAEERAGGRLGNKGEEYALTAIKMIEYAWDFQK